MKHYTLSNKNRPQEIADNLIKLDKEATFAFTEIIRQRDIRTAQNKKLLKDKDYLKSTKETDLQIEQAKENNALWWHRFKHLFTDDINTYPNPIHNRKISVFDCEYITYNEALFILLGLNPNALPKDNKKGIIFNRFNYEKVNLFTDRIDQDCYIYNTIEKEALDDSEYKNSEHIKQDVFLVWADRKGRQKITGIFKNRHSMIPLNFLINR